MDAMVRGAVSLVVEQGLRWFVLDWWLHLQRGGVPRGCTCRDSLPAAPDFSGLIAYDNANSGYWPEDCFLGDTTRQWMHGLVSIGNPQAVGIKDSGEVLVTGSTFFLGERRGFGFADNGVHHQYGGRTTLRDIVLVGDPNTMLGQNDIARPWNSQFTIGTVRVIDGGTDAQAMTASIRSTIPASRPPSSVRRAGLAGDGQTDELAPAEPTPGLGADLSPVGSLDELDAAPRTAYFYDASTATITVYAAFDWVVIER